MIVSIQVSISTITFHSIYCIKGVLEDIEDEFDMTDEWMGGLLQTAFIICYFASAPLFGFLGDRYSRKWLIISGIFIWSCCTMASSFMPVSFAKDPIKIETSYKIPN